MDSLEAQFALHYNSEKMQSLVEHMARAKWITGTNLVTPDDFWFNLTDRGRQRIEKGGDVLIRISPGSFKAENTSTLTANSIKKPSLVAWFLMFIKIIPIVWELHLPPFGFGEYEAMALVFGAAALKKGKNQVPPFRR